MSKMRFVKILFSVLFVAIVVFSVYIRVSDKSDYNSPVFKCDVDVINASVHDSEEKLLGFVSAYDEVDGDVTSDIIIESISPFINENSAVITFAVCDSHNNVSKLDKQIVYDDYTAPVFTFDKQHIYYVGATKVELLDGVKVTDSLDGDISSRVVVIDSQIDTSQPGTYKITYRATTSKGVTAQIDMNAYVYASRLKESILLDTYLVYTDINKAISPEDYIQQYPESYDVENRNNAYEYTFEIDDAGVDYSTPGIYHVLYRFSRTSNSVDDNETEILAESYLAVAVRGDVDA